MKGVHSQPLLLFLCWFMAWGGLKRLLIFILLRQTAFGIKGWASKGKGGRAVWKTRLEMGVKSQLWVMKENALLKPDPVAHWSLAWSESAGVSVQFCVVVNMHGTVCMFLARICLHTCRYVCRWKDRHGDLGRAQYARIRQVHKRR